MKEEGIKRLKKTRAYLEKVCEKKKSGEVLTKDERYICWFLGRGICVGLKENIDDFMMACSLSGVWED